MPDIEILGSVSGATSWSPEQVAAALSTDPTALRHGEAFTGRPATVLRVSGSQVVKLRTDVTHADAHAWTRDALARERALQVHHPAKTWFVARLDDANGVTLAGSICPLLQPLHVVWRDPLRDAGVRAGRLRQLTGLLRRYFEVRRSGWDLDLGLSNFGIDAAGELFYLDDDVYAAHPGHAGLGHMLAVYVRSQDWIDVATASAIGGTLAGLLRQEGSAEVSVEGLVGLLTQLYVPEGRPRDALSALAVAARQGDHRRSRAGARSAHRSARSRHLLAVLSDVHANLPALEAVLDFVELLRISDVIVLGDVVGYGPHPVECIERLAETSFQCIKGNHDYACSLELDEQPAHPIAMSRDARWVADWTAKRLSAEHRRWLRELPSSVERDGWFAVHGAPIDPNRFNGYVYEMTYERNLDELQAMGIRTCFHGHTHVQGVYARARGKLDAFYTADAQALDKYLHALVCPGSIGQPRNGMPGAQLAVYDRESHVVQFYSLAYAMDHAIADMERHGFPGALVARLRSAT